MPVKTKTKRSAAKHHGGLTMIPLRSWVAFWFFILVTMTLVIVCFTNAFRSIDREANRETAAAFQMIRQNLEARVAELQGQVGATQNTNSRALIWGHVQGCELTWDTSPAEVYITHLQTETKVSMSLPYSFAWGNDKYALLPGADHPSDTAVDFGPAVLGKDCYTSRDARVTVSNEISTPNKIRREAIDSYHATNIRERTLGGIPVLSYNVAWEDKHFNQWVGFGRNFQYTIHSQGWLTDAEAIKIIQSLKVVK
jgi:hypothetical protein